MHVTCDPARDRSDCPILGAYARQKRAAWVPGNSIGGVRNRTLAVHWRGRIAAEDALVESYARGNRAPA